MKGRDLQKSVTITFEEAAFGTKKQIKLQIEAWAVEDIFLMLLQNKVSTCL